jgi:hypothetical protein
MGNNNVYILDKAEKEAAEKYSLEKWEKAKKEYPDWEYDRYSSGYIDAVDIESEKDFIEGSQWRRRKSIDESDGSDYYLNGYKAALHDVEKEIDFAAVNQYKFPIIHLRDFIDKRLGRK